MWSRFCLTIPVSRRSKQSATTVESPTSVCTTRCKCVRCFKLKAKLSNSKTTNAEVVVMDVQPIPAAIQPQGRHIPNPAVAERKADDRPFQFKGGTLHSSGYTRRLLKGHPPSQRHRSKSPSCSAANLSFLFVQAVGRKKWSNPSWRERSSVLTQKTNRFW